MSKAMYGYMNNKYYRLKPDNMFIVIPENAQYKTTAIASSVDKNNKCAEVNAFSYTSNMTTDCNADRVAFMKEFLINEKIEDIETINNDYMIIMEYELFNKEGYKIKFGSLSSHAKYTVAYVTDSINSENSLEYRKALVFDNKLQITIPQVAKYGILSAPADSEYVLKINKFTLISSVDGGTMYTEKGSQYESLGNHACHASYHIKHPEPCLYNYGSHFITNAQIGTTIIDSVVVPAEMDVETPYEEVVICSNELGEDGIIKINSKLTTIDVNIEMMVDNFNEVYDEVDIDKIIELNKNTPSSPDSNSENVV